LHPADAVATSLEAECAALLTTETAARVAADPVLAHVAATFESLGPPPGSDDFSTVIIRHAWERLRRVLRGAPVDGIRDHVIDGHRPSAA